MSGRINSFRRVPVGRLRMNSSYRARVTKIPRLFNSSIPLMRPLLFAPSRGGELYIHERYIRELIVLPLDQDCVTRSAGRRHGFLPDADDIYAEVRPLID